MTENPPSVAEVVVAGGGIAALELVLALRELAGDRVHVTLVTPEPDFVPRPLLVAEPLGAEPAPRIPLRRIASDVGFRLVSAAVASVDGPGHRVALGSGDTLPYDTLVLTPGARTIAPYDDVILLGDPAGLEALRDEVRRDVVHIIAFVAPTLTGWLLPLYEAALITANADDRVRVVLVTPERQPLELFGSEASATVARALDAAGIEFIGSQHVDVSSGSVHLPAGSLAVDRVVTLPLVRGSRIPGVPAAGVFGLIPVDAYGRVDGLPDVYAAGDATDYPVKQGGIACQQADAVAAHIAARHGAGVEPAPFMPVLRALLLTGAGPPVALGEGDDHAKLPGRLLAPYLRAKSPAEAGLSSITT